MRKKYNRSYAKKMTLRQIKIRKWLAFLLFVCIVFAGYAGWAMEWPEYAIANVNIERPQDDNRTIKEQIWTMAESAGLTLDQRIKLIEVISCESKFDPYATNYNAKSKTYDLGIAQWNIHYNPHISKECAFDWKCAVDEMIKEYKKSGNLNKWVCSK
jgi:hypothetical protein